MDRGGEPVRRVVHERDRLLEAGDAVEAAPARRARRTRAAASGATSSTTVGATCQPRSPTRVPPASTVAPAAGRPRPRRGSAPCSASLITGPTPSSRSRQRAAARGTRRRRRRRRRSGSPLRTAGRRSRMPMRASSRPRGPRSASSHTTSAFLPPSSRQPWPAGVRPPLRSGARSPPSPVKLTRSTPRILDERHPASGPRPWTTLRTPAGRPASSQTGRTPGRERRVLGRLEHGAVAAEDRRKDLPGDVGQRRVERDQERRDADGLAEREHRAVRHARRSSCARSSGGPRPRRRAPSRRPRRSRPARARRLARLRRDELARLLAPLP